ncbi:MAG: hypothetical protein Q4A92_02185 [Corynebacterium sp.]|nr:hypothetical protein [Corynebacterium sp.]
MIPQDPIADPVPNTTNNHHAPDTGESSTSGGYQLQQEVHGISVGTPLGQVKEGLIATNGIPQMGKYYAVGHQSGVFIFVEKTEGDFEDAKITFLLPFNTADQLHFDDRADADAYFGTPANAGVDKNMKFAFYRTSQPDVFFLVQWLPGREGLIEITPVKHSDDFGSGQPLTANGRMAMGFGRVGPHDMSLTEHGLDDPEHINYCKSYKVTGDNHRALFVRGKLAGFYVGQNTSTGFVTTARGLGFGSSPDDVARVYPELNVSDTGQFAMSPHVMVESPNNPDIFLSFGIENGRITSMRTGTKEFADFHELCSSAN